MACGSYLLRIHLSTSTRLKFGRFKGGKIVELSAGEYLYIGSAMGQKGSTTLARRLVRHASRSSAKKPHALRTALIEHLQSTYPQCNALKPPDKKRLHWNVDHFLDLPSAEITAIYLLPTPQRIEDELAAFFAAEKQTIVFAKGLGANDAPGQTHLLRIEANERWWQELAGRLRTLFFRQSTFGFMLSTAQ